MTRILIIYTGGTIGMVNDPTTGMLRPFDFEQVRTNVPELELLKHEFSIHSFDPVIDSSDVNTAVWIELAKLIEKNYNQFDGFVVLHGSDTMAYTASMLSFMLENLAKPVIFTGSQLPIGEIRTDARENLITAIEIAASKEQGRAMVPEVCICFNGQLLRGNRSTKYHANSFDAFRSVNHPCLVEAGVHLIFNKGQVLPLPEASFKVHTELNEQVAVLKVFPGISAATLNAIASSGALKIIILETFGAGNACTQDWFLEELKEAINRGILILDITQCAGGSVELGRYETSKYLQEMGVVSGYDMTFEAAVTKSMFLLGQGLSGNKLKEQLQSSLRGELTVS